MRLSLRYVAYTYIILCRRRLSHDSKAVCYLDRSQGAHSFGEFSAVRREARHIRRFSAILKGARGDSHLIPSRKAVWRRGQKGLWPYSQSLPGQNKFCTPVFTLCTDSKCSAYNHCARSCLSPSKQAKKRWSDALVAYILARDLGQSRLRPLARGRVREALRFQAKAPAHLEISVACRIDFNEIRI